jgi:hypothetical protein
MTLADQEKSNLIIGAILADLLSSWPTGSQLSAEKMLPSLIERPIKEDVRMLIALVRWLSDEGYLRYQSATLDGSYHGVVLSEKGLRVLNSVPKGISGNKSYGQKIAEAAQDVSQEAAKRTIADLVGQMIGGVVKSMSS